MEVITLSGVDNDSIVVCMDICMQTIGRLLKIIFFEKKCMSKRIYSRKCNNTTRFAIPRDNKIAWRRATPQ